MLKFFPCALSRLCYFNKINVFAEVHRQLTFSKRFKCLVRRYSFKKAHIKQETEERSQELTHKLKLFISENASLCPNKWLDFRNELIECHSSINANNIDSVIMGTCANLNLYDVGHSYWNFINSSGIEPNVSTIGRYLMLCYNTKRTNQITPICELLFQKYPVLDATTSENVICALSLTDNWRQGFSFMANVKLTCSPSTKAYSALICAAFQNNCTEEGWKLIHELVFLQRVPPPSVFISWCEYCKRQQSDKLKLLQKMLYFFKQFNIIPTLEVVEKVKELFEDSSWLVVKTHVHERGHCNHCQLHLKWPKISEQEFKKVKSAFMDKVIIGSDVFIKTSPDELHNFQKFVEKTSPYDVVIDGLNVSYTVAHSKSSPLLQAKLVQNLVKYYVDKGKKVLVVGRKHMLKWHPKYMKYIRENCHMFLTQNVTADDPFILYAALYSGSHTQILSRDLMRSHSFLLNDFTLRSIFNTWLRQHQYQISWIDGKGKILFKNPLRYNPYVQYNEETAWHIPYELEYSPSLTQASDPSTNWMCILKQNKLDEFSSTYNVQKEKLA